MAVWAGSRCWAWRGGTWKDDQMLQETRTLGSSQLSTHAIPRQPETHALFPSLTPPSRGPTFFSGGRFVFAKEASEIILNSNGRAETLHLDIPNYTLS